MKFLSVSLNIAQTDPDRLESLALTNRSCHALRQAPVTQATECSAMQCQVQCTTQLCKSMEYYYIQLDIKIFHTFVQNCTLGTCHTENNTVASRNLRLCAATQHATTPHLVLFIEPTAAGNIAMTIFTNSPVPQ